VTHSRTGVLNIARTANRWLPVGCILAPDSLCGGQRTGSKEQRQRRPGDVCLLEQSRPHVETRTFPCLTLNGRWVAACAAGCWPFSPPARHKVLGFRN
jgi:hypothetical protein